MLTELLNRLRYLLSRSRFDSELNDELRFHLEARTADLQAEGLSPAAARVQARREFGSSTRALEETRAAWQFRWLEDLASDLRYAARSFRRNPAFAATAVVCLALGIGVNTTIFSIANEVLFSRPSVRDPQTLAALRVGGNSAVQMDIYRFLRNAAIFDGLIGEHEEGEINWRDGAVTSRLFPMRVTENFFAVSGTPVAMGRPIQPGETDTVVVSDSLWQGRLGGDPHAVGRTMILDGRIYTIVGILPRDHRTLFGFGFSPDVYLPVSDDKTYVTIYARMPAGMTRAIAYARLTAACRELDGPHPPKRHQWARGISVTAVSGMDRLRTDTALISIAAFFGMLLIVVGLVLLIACANVASLLLARASSQEHEIAIRLSIGAGRGRLIRQLLTESLLLALCGTAAGLALNFLLTNALSRIRIILPVALQYHIQPDLRLLAYSAAVAIGTSLVAGLLPALKATRSAATAAALKRDEHQVVGRWTLRNALVIGQLALSIVLLSAGLLFVRNLIGASTSNPGFDLQHTAWAYMRLVPESYTNPEKTREVARVALEHLRSLPGVDSAALATVVPLNNNMTMGMPVRTDLASEPEQITFRFNNVGPDYFHVMQIAILRGREFLPTDRRGAPRVAILNETMARRLFGHTDPIGHTITWGDGSEVVIGVARNSKYFTLGEDNMAALYAPYDQMGRTIDDLHFLIRAAGAPQALIAPVNAALGRLDATAAIETKPMSQALVFALLPSRCGAAVLGSVGLLGISLAAIGLYGVLLYSVTRRSREIGLRIALGASPHDVLSLVLRQSATLAAAGIVIGIALAIFAVRPLAMFLTPEVRPTDPGTFVAVAALLLTVAVAATISPALRAVRVDPMTALRHD
jgi:predicted permease